MTKLIEIKKFTPDLTANGVGTKLAEVTNTGLAVGRGLMGYIRDVGKAYLAGVRKPLDPKVVAMAEKALDGETVEADLPNGYHIKIVNREVVEFEKIKEAN